VFKGIFGKKKKSTAAVPPVSRAEMASTEPVQWTCPHSLEVFDCRGATAPYNGNIFTKKNKI